MKRMRKKAGSIIRLFLSSGPEKDVPKFWIARTGSRLDSNFAVSTPHLVTDFDGYLRIDIKDQIFLWPKNAPIAGALQIFSEILTPEHPHQYLYGQTQIGKNDVVMDIGACEGAFSAVVASQCAHVIAVEPSRLMCELMPVLFRLRNEPCPTILNCLLGAESGHAYFLENRDNPGHSMIVPEAVQGAYEIPVRALDEVVEDLERKPTFIKCDAEGAEFEIFSGGKHFLRTHRPRLAITTYHNNGDYAAMYAFLASLGYNVAGKGFLFSGETLRVQMIHAW